MFSAVEAMIQTRSSQPRLSVIDVETSRILAIWCRVGTAPSLRPARPPLHNHPLQSRAHKALQVGKPAARRKTDERIVSTGNYSNDMSGDCGPVAPSACHLCSPHAGNFCHHANHACQMQAPTICSGVSKVHVQHDAAISLHNYAMINGRDCS